MISDTPLSHSHENVSYIAITLDLSFREELWIGDTHLHVIYELMIIKFMGMYKITK